MEKQKIKWKGHDYYLLGICEGKKFYLEAGTWDCDWYWGFGYISTFTNNANPELSIDVRSHNHFDSMFLKNYTTNCYDAFCNFFDETPFTEKEIWKLLELMKSFYTASKYSEMVHIGGSHITSNPLKETIKNEVEYKRINEVIIPGIMQEIYKVMY